MDEKESHSWARANQSANQNANQGANRRAAAHQFGAAQRPATAAHHAAPAYQSASASAYNPVFSTNQYAAAQQRATSKRFAGASRAASQRASASSASTKRTTKKRPTPAKHSVSQRANGNHSNGDRSNGNHSNGNQSSSKKGKLSRGKKIAITVLSVFLGLILITVGALALWVKSLESTMSLSEEDLMALSEVLVPVESENDPFYMLILGSDARTSSSTGRADVIMLVRVDPSTATVDLISIPRDTMVTIEGYGTQKINAAYAYGGAALAVSCVSEFAGVDISHYVEVRFEDLEELVDTLGGIWVNIPEDIEAGNGGMAFSAGEQLLNGEQALALARERYNVTGGDFGRIQSQRLIVEAFIERVLSVSLTELPSVIEQLAGCVSTDYSVADLISLAQKFIGEDVTIYSASCPSYTLYQNGVSYVATMFDEWQAMMQRVDAGLDPEDEDAEIPEEQANNSRLGAATNSPAPRDYEALAASSLTTDDVVDIE